MAAMDKASFGFASFQELEDPYIYGPLERMAFNLNDCVNSNFTFSQSTLDDVLAPAAMGGLSTPKSVGYYLRFLASSRLKRQFLAAGKLRKDNPRVIEQLSRRPDAARKSERVTNIFQRGRAQPPTSHMFSGLKPPSP